MRLYGRLVLVGGLAALTLTGCATSGPGTSGPPSGTATSTGTPPVSATPPPPPATEPTQEVEYRVTYGFAVPTSPVTIQHEVHPPIAGPSLPPLPYLVGIYVGDHPEGTPKYQRISFYFRGAFPGYRFNYAASVLGDGSGAPISLQGNTFLQIVFVDAQAHDNAGASTVAAKPANPINYKNLKSYAPAGDFEGHVTYGLGIQVAPNSDQILPIRAGELKKPDGAGGFFYVVHFDIQTG